MRALRWIRKPRAGAIAACSRPLFTLLACSLVGLPGPSRAAAQTPRVTLSLDGSEPAETVEVDLGTQENAASRQLFIARAVEDTTAMVVELVANPPRGTVAFSPSSVTLPVRGEWADVTLNVSNVAAGGFHSAWIVARVGGESLRLARLTIRKATPLALAEAGENGVEVSHPVPEFERSFSLVSESSSPTVATLAVDDFTGPRNESRAARVTVNGRYYEGDSLTIPPMGTLRFTVAASLPVVGEHVSNIRVAYGNERLDVPLTINRISDSLTVQMDSLLDVAVTRDFFGRPTTAPFKINLRETAGVPVDLSFPKLVRFVRKAPGETSAREIEAAGDLRIEGLELDEAVIFDRFGTSTLDARVEGLEAPGEHTGIVRFTTATNGVVQGALTIFVRESALWAAFWILLGVAVGEGLRYWYRERKQSLVDRHALAVIEDDLEGLQAWVREASDDASPEESQRLLQALLDNVRSVYLATLGPASKVVGDDQMEDLRAKAALARRWVHADVQAEDLNIRTAQKDAFRGAAKVIESRTVDAARRKTAADHLDTIEDAIDAALRAAAAERAFKITTDAAPAEVRERVLPPLPGVPSRGAIMAQYLFERRLVWIAVAAIALAVGLKAIYMGDLDWGGWSDRMVALLWGLGVEAVSGSPLQGVASITAKFQKAPES